MANTYTSLFYHLVFSTKNREPWLLPNLEQRIWSYLAGVARAQQITPLQIGGVEDHIHALVMARPTIAVFEIAKFLKGDSSKWIHQEFSHMKGFGWQDGYGGFSVSKSDVPDVIRYIRNQREHHRRKTFREEYLELLREHGIQYDERYVWG
jgi:REP element-mobilizing transposase RayT